MKIDVNFDVVTGKIKPMHAVGQPPFKGGSGKMDFTPMQILKDANIPYSRLHDVGGAFGGGCYVDIPNVFRNFDADENDPASYDFAFTDVLIEALFEYDIKPYFRLGVTIENYRYVKAYHINPPKDYAKWARICEHVVRHYTEGWADGYSFDIEYWEIWNEPENRDDPTRNNMWTGTPEQYYELYDVTSKHLKNCFGDKIKIGGYGASGFYGIFADPEKYGLDIEKRDGPRYVSAREEHRMAFLYGFFDYIKKNNSPIDFFTWHTYGGVDIVSVEADFVDKFLKEQGYEGLENHLNEWNLSHSRAINCSNSAASANVMAMMITMQHKNTDMLMYYDARYISTSAYTGFYDLETFEPSCVYYAIKAFGEIYSLENEVECGKTQEGIYAIAAKEGDKKAVIVSNTGSDAEIELELPCGFSVYVIDKENHIAETDFNPKKFNLKENTIAIIKNF